jgi:hypothetical protein
MWQQATGLPRFRPRIADRAARSCAQTEKVCRQAPAKLLEDILNRLLQEKRT